jgi:prepilin-type N-terminal cleavage/methylation domain-containing protein
MSRRKPTRARGFSLVELMTALAILLIVCGVAFALLTVSMKKYHSDSQLLNTFQEARFGLDQIVRDINDSGFPPRVAIQATNSPPVPFQRYAVAPFAWGPLGTYPNSPCAIGTTCSLTPSSYDMIIETDIDPDNHQGTVEWVRYQLNGTTLYRGVIAKSSNPGDDPEAITSGVLVPYVQNVVNNPPAAQLATLQAQYPLMFPSGPVPVFQYFCESTPQPLDCTSTSPPPTTDDPTHVVAVVVTLIVQAPTTDMTTGRLQLVQLKGEGRRLNPDN